MESAQKLFEALGGDSGKPGGPPPSWEAQPESLKEVFRNHTKPGSRFYHYGMNTVFATRLDGSLYSFIPFTETEARQNPAHLRRPSLPSKGGQDLRRICVIEHDMKSIAERYSTPEDRRAARDAAKKSIYEIWRGISDKDVSRAVLMEIYETYVDKAPEVKLPAWMQEIVDQQFLRAQSAQVYKDWLESMSEEDRVAYKASFKYSDFAGQEHHKALQKAMLAKYPRKSPEKSGEK